MSYLMDKYDKREDKECEDDSKENGHYVSN